MLAQTLGAGDVVLGLLLLAAVLLVWHCPIFKPWFGFRKPPGHRGRWFQ